MKEPQSSWELRVCAALRWNAGVLQGYFVKLYSDSGNSPSVGFSGGEWIDVPGPSPQPGKPE